MSGKITKDQNVFKMRLSVDRTFDVVNLVLMIVMLLVFAWPLWFVVIASFSDTGAVYRGEVILFPKGITLESYRAIVKYRQIWIGYRNTIFYTVAGTLINLFITICLAYPLSRRKFMPKKIIMAIALVTMYFGGGLIPSYLVVRGLHMTNTIWAMMIPNALSVYNMLIVRAYFCNSIPVSLEEASTLDGAGPMQYLARVVLPLSKPVLAVIALYYMVGHWNDYYSALIYINDQALRPLQSFMRDLLVNNSVTRVTGGSLSPEEMQAKLYLAQTLKYSSIIVATVPMLVVYPFVQKYFVKGVMVGSIKG